MAQVINTNILSLNAQRNLNSTSGALQTSLQRLSSGLRINSAKDDAAGLAISERFTTQIRGLNQAIRNANDGISLAQTGEAALATVTDNLQRIRELAVQSVNATNSDTDRATLQQEVTQRLNEIDRISSQTSFNGRTVLDGTFGSALFQVGANVGETIGLDLGTDVSVRTSDVGSLARATTADLSGLANAGGVVNLASGALTIGGEEIVGSFESAAELAALVNGAGITGLTASVSGAEVSLANSTGSAIAISADTANLFTATEVGAATTTPTPGTDTIDSALFNEVAVSTFTVTFTGGSGSETVAAGNYTNAELADAINTAYLASGGAGTFASVDVDGNLDLDNTSGAAVTLSGADLNSQLGLTFTSGTDVAISDSGSATVLAGVFDSFAVTGLTVDIGAGGGAQTITNGVYSQAEMIDAINAAATGIASDVGGVLTITNSTANAFTFAGANASTLGLSTVAAQTSSTANGTAASDGAAAAIAAATAQTLTTSGLTIQFGDSAALAIEDGIYTSPQDFVDAVNVALGSNATAVLNSDNTMSITSGEAITIGGNDTSESVFTGTSFAIDTATSLSDTLVTTVADANLSIARVDAALTAVSELRSTFGAIQNRFESTIANLSTTSENLQASRSRILDADFAQETANLTRAQILQQAGISVLSQANAAPQSVLALLQ